MVRRTVRCVSTAPHFFFCRIALAKARCTVQHRFRHNPRIRRNLFCQPDCRSVLFPHWSAIRFGDEFSYGFGGKHVNQAIVDAAEADEPFGMFVVNPSGRKALRPCNDIGQTTQPRPEIEDARYIDGPIRSLGTTFTNDEPERAKLVCTLLRRLNVTPTCPACPIRPRESIATPRACR